MRTGNPMMLWPFFDTGPPLCAAATLATLARETAEDVFDAMTTDCTEPHRLPPRERNTMTTPTPNKLPRYRAVLVAGPASASAGLDGPLIDKARRLEACNIADIDPARVAALAAERDRLALEVAALRGALETELARWDGRHYDGSDGSDIDIGYAIREALSATPTPPAAEAVTGGGGAEATP